MDISFHLKNRQLLWAAFLLLIPDAFFWYASLGSFLTDPVQSLNYLSSNNYLSISATVYLLIFFALFVKGERIWKPYFLVLATTLGIYRYISSADTWNMDGLKAKTILNHLFIKFENQMPIQALGTLSMIIIIYLSISEFGKVVKTGRSLLNRVTGNSQFSVKSTFATIVYLVVTISLIVTEFMTLKNLSAARSGQFMESGFKWTLAFGWILGIIMILLQALIFTIFAVFFFSTVNSWWRELGQLWLSLKDFRINKYITRLITGYMYTYLFLFTVIAMALITPIATFGAYGASYGMEVHPIALAYIPAGAIVGVFLAMAVLLVIRLLVEVSVALIHIAQNTSKS